MGLIASRLTAGRLRVGLGGGLLAALVSLTMMLVTAQSATVPAPSNVTGDAVRTGLEIEWDAPNTSGGDVVGRLVGYEILRTRAGGTFQTLVEDTGNKRTIYTDRSGDPNERDRFTAGAAYLYRVRAIYEDSDGNKHRSDASHHKPVWVPWYPTPANMERETITNPDGSTDVKLSWDAPSLPWGSDAASLSGYEIVLITGGAEEDNSSGSVVSLDADQTSYTDVEHHESNQYQLVALYGIFETRARHFPDP